MMISNKMLSVFISHSIKYCCFIHSYSHFDGAIGTKTMTSNWIFPIEFKSVCSVEKELILFPLLALSKISSKYTIKSILFQFAIFYVTSFNLLGISHHFLLRCRWLFIFKRFCFCSFWIFFSRLLSVTLDLLQKKKKNKRKSTTHEPKADVMLMLSCSFSVVSMGLLFIQWICL